MFAKYSADEAFALIIALITAIGCWVPWYFSLAVTGRRVRPRGRRYTLALAPVICALLLNFVLRRWSAEDVRTDNAYLLFYMVMGAGWLGLFRLQLPFLGLSTRDDVLERGNDATGSAAIGALLGGTFCFAGANVGNGPGWWVVLYSALLSTASLGFFWKLLHAASGLQEKVSLDRDSAAGLRAAGLLVGAGLILGRAVAGDWVSMTATTLDFARMGWPVLILAGFGIAVERACTRDYAEAPLHCLWYGWLPALVYTSAGLVNLPLW